MITNPYDLPSDLRPTSPREKLLKSGVSVYSYSKELDSILEESPDGTIRKVKSITDNGVLYEEENCPNFG